MDHVTVLRKEAVDALALEPHSVVVDATYGNGGHSREILSRMSHQGTLIGIDVDPSAFIEAPIVGAPCTLHLVANNFSNIAEILNSLNISHVNAILADLGWRMSQFAEGGKGLSFQYDEPLYMTFGNPDQYDFTAETIVNEWDESVIADIIYGYGNESFARKIAKAIVLARTHTPITTSKQLADIIERAIPRKAGPKRIHPATKTFQALRIAVNKELAVLETFIKDSFLRLAPHGRLAIITFHSIEDRIVKHMFRELVQIEQAEYYTKKPITPTQEEIKENPRSRSAKLRVIIKQREL